METPATQKEPVRIGITLPTNAYFMSGIRDFTLSLIKNMTNFGDQWAYRFQAVVDELCNNAIEHGSAPNQEISVVFQTHPEEQSMEIIVEDTGTGKTKASAAAMQKMIAERTNPGYPFTEIRGRGLAKIVHAWTDELEFTDIPNKGLRVRIKKYLQPRTAPPMPGTAPQDPTHITLSS